VNLEWIKKHPYVVAAGGLVLLLVFYLIFKSSSGSGNSLDSAIEQQNQGQLQMAQLNAQLSAQSEQTQAQLTAGEYETQAQEQEEQDQTAGSLASEIIPEELQSGLYGQELTAEEQELSDQYNLAEQGVNLTMLGGSGQTGQAVRNAGLGIIGAALGEGVSGESAPPSSGISINFGSLGQGLFG
jgi:hypothetical protein